MWGEEIYRRNPSDITSPYVQYPSHNIHAYLPSFVQVDQNQWREGICSQRKYLSVLCQTPLWNNLLQDSMYLYLHNLTWSRFNSCTIFQRGKGRSKVKIKPPNSSFNLNLVLEWIWKGLKFVKIHWTNNHQEQIIIQVGRGGITRKFKFDFIFPLPSLILCQLEP